MVRFQKYQRNSFLNSVGLKFDIDLDILSFYLKLQARRAPNFRDW